MLQTTVCTIATICLLVAGTTTREGTTAQGKSGRQEFASPMILETEFVLTDPASWDGRTWHGKETYRELADYVCDSVALKEMKMRARRLEGGQDIEVRIKGEVFNRKGHGKEVTLDVEILNGEEAAARGSKRFGVEEDESSGWSVSIPVPAAAIVASPATRLRITMRVKDD